MLRLKVVVISLLVVLALAIGFVGGTVSAFNPQPEPPGYQMKLDSMIRQVEVLGNQLHDAVPNVLTDDPVGSDLLRRFSEATLDLSAEAGRLAGIGY